jgi:hypothetical protein
VKINKFDNIHNCKSSTNFKGVIALKMKNPGNFFDVFLKQTGKINLNGDSIFSLYEEMPNKVLYNFSLNGNNSGIAKIIPSEEFLVLLNGEHLDWAVKRLTGYKTYENLIKSEDKPALLRAHKGLLQLSNLLVSSFIDLTGFSNKGIAKWLEQFMKDKSFPPKFESYVNEAAARVEA